VVVVTGGASGIGEAAAMRFGEAGDFIVVADLDETNGARVVDALGGSANAAFHALNVGDRDAVAQAAEAIEQRHGGVEVLVNSAGILQQATPLEAFDDAEHDRLWDVNYRGTYMCCRYFGMRMAGRHRGAIVNIASISGMLGLPQLAYAPGKAAVIHLTKVLGGELGRRGVRVNAIAPGLVMTPVQKRNIQQGLRDATGGARAAALNRWVEPEEIADGIFFLCSDQARAILGVTLPIDAGFLATHSWSLLGGVKHELEG